MTLREPFVIIRIAVAASISGQDERGGVEDAGDLVAAVIVTFFPFIAASDQPDFSLSVASKPSKSWCSEATCAVPSIRFIPS